MFVVCFEETIIGGRRLEHEAAHREALAALARAPGFRGGALLHFRGQPYRYRFETRWASRDEWQRFAEGAGFPVFRERLDANLSAPFVTELFDVKMEG
jgi:heme-degrading monooxygenase HmoA